jgi:hypothetical protein
VLNLFGGDVLDSADLLGEDSGLLARALAAALSDHQILVQRGSLEILVGSFPMKNG